MAKTRQDWLVVANADPVEILIDWGLAETEAAAQLEEAGDQIKDQQFQIEDLKGKIASGPEWGNCKRGCPPAYLNNDGFCSPACGMGAPRGQYANLVERGIREYRGTATG